jgi:hypothetical protein
MLDFLSADYRHPEAVWRAELPASVKMRHAKVEYRGEFGWVLVLRYTHEDAAGALVALDLSECVYGLVGTDVGKARA